jgi:hypothetical protein
MLSCGIKLCDLHLILEATINLVDRLLKVFYVSQFLFSRFSCFPLNIGTYNL